MFFELQKEIGVLGKIEIDLDTPSRMIKSPYDFRILSRDYLLVCEAKKVFGKAKPTYTQEQGLTRLAYPSFSVPHCDLVFKLRSNKHRILDAIQWDMNFAKLPTITQSVGRTYEDQTEQEILEKAVKLFVLSVRDANKE